MGPMVVLAAWSAAAAASGSGECPKPGGERCGGAAARERSAYSCVAGGLSASAERARLTDAPFTGELDPATRGCRVSLVRLYCNILHLEAMKVMSM